MTSYGAGFSVICSRHRTPATPTMERAALSFCLWSVFTTADIQLLSFWGWHEGKWGTEQEYSLYGASHGSIVRTVWLMFCYVITICLYCFSRWSDHPEYPFHDDYQMPKPSSKFLQIIWLVHFVAFTMFCALTGKYVDRPFIVDDISFWYALFDVNLFKNLITSIKSFRFRAEDGVVLCVCKQF